MWDIAAGAAGSLYTLGRQHSGVLRATRLKMGYARRSDSYWERMAHPQVVDDYVNQTYWLSLDVEELLPPALETWWPGFLRLAVGIGIDETTDGAGGGSREVYVGLDYSLQSIFGRPRSPFLRGILSFVEYIKLPAPAIRLTPDVRTYGLYW